MAKLRISADLVREFLLCRAPIDITAARMDVQRDVLELEISGHGIPDVEEVDAVLTLSQSTIHFRPANASAAAQLPAQLRSAVDKIGKAN